MVKVINRKNRDYYQQCEECGFLYAEKKWAEKCEAWCKEHHSCNLEIIAHGMPPTENASNPEN